MNMSSSLNTYRTSGVISSKKNIHHIYQNLTFHYHTCNGLSTMHKSPVWTKSIFLTRNIICDLWWHLQMARAISQSLLRHWRGLPWLVWICILLNAPNHRQTSCVKDASLYYCLKNASQLQCYCVESWFKRWNLTYVRQEITAYNMPFTNDI